MSGPIRILYVDDYPLDRELVRDALVKEHDSFQFVEAASRAEFETLLDANDYDLVLSDFNILGFEGLQVLDAVHAKDPRVPVIIVTGTGSEEIAVEALKRGAADYVIKTPKHIRRLPTTIYAVLEKKRLEEEHSLTEKALRESEANLKEAQALGRIGNWEFDLTTQAIQWSDQVYRLYERDPALRPPSSEEEAAYYAPEQAEKLREYARLVAQEGRAFDYDLGVRLPGGKIAHFAATMRPVSDERGRIIKLFGTVQDITERKQAEQELQQHREHLEELVRERTAELQDVQEELICKEKLAALGQLAGGVAHELRNPLGVINNVTYLLNMALKEQNPEVRDALATLKKEVEISERIINSLLKLAYPAAPIQRKVHLNDLVREIPAKFTIPENIEIVYQLGQTLPVVWVDPDHVVQMFGHIMLNAIQAMSEGGQLVIATSETSGQSAEERWVTVSFTDMGIGIPKENIKKLFEPLFTTKARGIGLGLALVKSLTDASGGRIEVESKEREGSTFTLFFPGTVSSGQ